MSDSRIFKRVYGCKLKRGKSWVGGDASWFGRFGDNTLAVRKWVIMRSTISNVKLIIATHAWS